MKRQAQRSGLLIGLILFAVVWTALMGLGVGRVSPTAESAGQSDAAQFGAGAHIMYVDESAFPEITVYMAVNDAAGQPILGLGKDDFVLEEDGQVVDITNFAGAGGAATSTLLVIDISGSMQDEGKLSGAVSAAQTYIDFLQAGVDQVGVIVFSSGTITLSPLETVTDQNRALLHQQLAALVANGGTRFYTATREAIRAIANTPGRKVILALTDGLDDSGQSELEQTIQEAQGANAPIYTVGLGSNIDRMGLEMLARRSGGEAHFSPDAAQLQALYQSIASGLRNEYALTYRSATPHLDGTRRNLEAQIAGQAGDLHAGGSYAVGGILSSGLNLAIFLPTLLLLLALLLGLLWAPRLFRRGSSDRQGDHAGLGDGAQPDAPNQLYAPKDAQLTGIPERAERIPAERASYGIGAVAAPAATARQATLIVEWTLGGETVIGSGSTATLILADTSLAAAHARIVQEGARWIIEDLTGAGATRVSYNGDPLQARPVQRNALRDGSLIQLGAETMVFRQEQNMPPVIERRIEIGGEGALIGTTSRCTVRLSGAEALEAQMGNDGQRWFIAPILGNCQVSFKGDLGQFRPISDRNALRDGSRIRLGATTLRLAI